MPSMLGTIEEIKRWCAAKEAYLGPDALGNTWMRIEVKGDRLLLATNAHRWEASTFAEAIADAWSHLHSNAAQNIRWAREQLNLAMQAAQRLEAASK